MSAYSLRRRLALKSPPHDDPSVHTMDTREIELPTPVLLTMMSAEEVARMRRHQRLDALDRANPFLHPSPDAPWTPTAGPDAPRRPAERRAWMQGDASLVEVAVVTWGVVIALAMLALLLS
jgi:hypothetical protein